MQLCQALLDVIELAAADRVFRLFRQQLVDRLLDRLDPALGHWVGTECLRDGVLVLLLLSFEALEELDHRGRVVPCFVQILHAKEIGLVLELPRELQHGHRNGEVGRLLNAVTRPAADKQQRDAGVLDQLCPCRTARAVTRRHVGNLVRHDPSEFGFVLSQLDQAGVDIEVAARQGERVDLVGVDHLDCERHLGIGIVDDVLSDPVDVLGDHWILHDLGVPLDVCGQLLAKLDFLFQAVEVDRLANVAVANLGDILLVVIGQALAFCHRLAHLGRAQPRSQQQGCQRETSLGECALHLGPQSQRMVPASVLSQTSGAGIALRKAKSWHGFYNATWVG